MSGSWVVASAEAALCGRVCVAASRSKVELGWGSRRESTGEDATLAELGRRELRRSIGERGWHRVTCMAGGLCSTEVFTNRKWNCAPEGMFGKTQLQKLRVAWCVGHRAQRLPSVYGRRE